MYRYRPAVGQAAWYNVEDDVLDYNPFRKIGTRRQFSGSQDGQATTAESSMSRRENFPKSQRKEDGCAVKREDSSKAVDVNPDSNDKSHDIPKQGGVLDKESDLMSSEFKSNINLWLRGRSHLNPFHRDQEGEAALDTWNHKKESQLLKRPRVGVCQKPTFTLFDWLIFILLNFAATRIAIAYDPGILAIGVFVVNFIAIISLACTLSYVAEQIGHHARPGLHLDTNVLARVPSHRYGHTFRKSCGGTIVISFALATIAYIPGLQIDYRSKHLTAILLVVAYGCYMFFQLKTHSTLYDTPDQKLGSRQGQRKEDLDNSGDRIARSQSSLQIRAARCFRRAKSYIASSSPVHRVLLFITFSRSAAGLPSPTNRSIAQIDSAMTSSVNMPVDLAVWIGLLLMLGAAQLLALRNKPVPVWGTLMTSYAFGWWCIRNDTATSLGLLSALFLAWCISSIQFARGAFKKLHTPLYTPLVTVGLAVALDLLIVGYITPSNAAMAQADLLNLSLCSTSLALGITATGLAAYRRSQSRSLTEGRWPARAFSIPELA